MANNERELERRGKKPTAIDRSSKRQLKTKRLKERDIDKPRG